MKAKLNKFYQQLRAYGVRVQSGWIDLRQQALSNPRLRRLLAVTAVSVLILFILHPVTGIIMTAVILHQLALS